MIRSGSRHSSVSDAPGNDEKFALMPDSPELPKRKKGLGQTAHHALGFDEVERLVHCRKRLI
jgi:hypothetical protein